LVPKGFLPKHALNIWGVAMKTGVKLIEEHRVCHICDKQLLSSFLYQVILLTLVCIKLSVSGKADIEYSACTRN
jgi:hypothetical protein